MFGETQTDTPLPCTLPSHECKQRLLSESKESACNAGDPGFLPGPGKGNGNTLQYSCLENPIDGGAWRATAQGVAKRQTRLSD